MGCSCIHFLEMCSTSQLQVNSVTVPKFWGEARRRVFRQFVELDSVRSVKFN
jgi:hypothetical protein